jgi:hypothetical protein
MRTVSGALFGALLAAALLAGCAARAPLPSPTSTPAPIPTANAAPTLTPTPSATLAPTLTPTAAVRALSASAALTIDGQPVKALAFAPAGATAETASVVHYAILGGNTGGLARSDDGGRTWKRVTATGAPAVIAGGEPRTLYAGPLPSCYKGTGLDMPVSRSSDGGATWQTFKGSEGIRPVAVHPTKAGTVYGISCRGLNISRDGGQTWQNSGPTMGWDITSLLLVPGQPLRFLAVLTSEGGTSHLAWFDEDGRGEATSPAQDGATPSLQFWGTGALAAAGSVTTPPGGETPPLLYLAEATGVRRSVDGGATWTRWQDGLADVALAHDPLKDGMTQEEVQKGYGLLALSVDPADPNSLFLGTVRGLYLSADGGQHWRKADIAALNSQRITGLQWDPARSGVLYAGTAQGVYEVK